MNLRSWAPELFRTTQDDLCTAFEKFDGSRFRTDRWTRDSDEGGGITRVLRGQALEQAGVNFSEVHGTLAAEVVERLIGVPEPRPFYATGISVVVHPRSPMIPTTHANLRYLEVGDRSWFGGGTDLTPYYLFDDDARHFHSVLKNACGRHDKEFYPRFKKMVR